LSEQKKTPSKVVYEIACKKIRELVISQENSNEVYTVVNINNQFETVSLSSKRAQDWLRALDTEVHGKQFYQSILEKIASTAQISEVRKEVIHNRIAFENDVIYYDLARKDGRIVKISTSGVEEVPYHTDMPFFRRSSSTQEQVEPRFGDNEALEKLTQLSRIKDAQVYQVHLTAFFLEHIPIPIMDFDGPAGTMKSIDSSLTKRIVDPNGIKKEDNISSMPKKIDDMNIQMYNRYQIVYDNLSYIPREVSDTLCKAITGSSNSKRTLYTDMDEIILSIKRKLIINGISPNLERPDLQDRIISYEREPLEKDDRLTEEEIEEKFQELLPSILGQIFETLKKAMEIHKQVKKEIKPRTRMADFEIWGESISRALGYKSYSFLEKYHEKIRKKSISLIESQPLVKAIVSLLEKTPIYENSMEATFHHLKEIGIGLGIDVGSKYERFPKSSSKLSSELIIIEPHLAKLGIKYQKTNYTKHDGRFKPNTAVVSFTKIENSESSEASEDSNLFFELKENKENIKKIETVDYFSIVP